MVFLDTPKLEASVMFIFLNFSWDFSDESDESGTNSFFFMFFSSLVCSLTTFLHILYNWVDLGSLDSLVPVGGSSKLFYFFKVFFGGIRRQETKFRTLLKLLRWCGVQ